MGDAVRGLMPAAQPGGISPRAARKWRGRLVQEGLQGMLDRSSRPVRTLSPVDAELAERIEQLRHASMPMRRIAAALGRSVAAVSRLLAGLGLSSLRVWIRRCHVGDGSARSSCRRPCRGVYWLMTP